jgi:hypothetical protein
VLPFDPALAKAMAGNSPAEQMGRLNAAKGSLKDHPELQPLIVKITTAYEAYRPVGETHLKLRAARDAARSQAAGVQDGMKSLRASLDSLFAEISRRRSSPAMGINAVESAVTVAAVEGPNIGLQRARDVAKRCRAQGEGCRWRRTRLPRNIPFHIIWFC